LKDPALVSNAVPLIDETGLADSITGEIYMALGRSKTGPLRRATGWMLRPIARRFARMWLRFDDDCAREGLQGAAREFLVPFVREVRVRGAEHIPGTGPLIVASNHPGAYDSMAIASQIGHASPKVIVSDIPMIRLLPNASAYAIFAYGEGGNPTLAVRAGLRHLRAGGALMIFATGLVDPDPDLWPDEAPEHLEHWSPSLELFLRHVPATRLAVAIASGVISPRWARSPIARLGRTGHERRRLAEFLQVIAQLVRPGKDLYTPRVSFAPALSLVDLGGARAPIMENIITHAKALLAEHNAWR
jgi:hypothetical protein